MIHLLVGIQGSGKTTFSKILAKKLKADIVSTDAIRKANPGILEKLVWVKVYEDLANALKNNKEVVFDATSINRNVRKRFFDNVSSYGVTVKAGAYFLDTEINECIKRVEKRNLDKNELYLPIEVINSYSKSLEIPSLDEGFMFVKVVRNNKIIKNRKLFK